MSSLWTPSGERPIRREEPPTTEAPSAPTGGAAGAGTGAGSAGAAGDTLTEEELAAQMAEAQRQLLEAPVSAVVANHCIGLFQLAALHLNQPQPNFEDTKLAIDALAAVVEGVGARLGQDESTLRDALAQIRLAYVQVKAAKGG
jgi:hypothetical protein